MRREINTTVQEYLSEGGETDTVVLILNNYIITNTIMNRITNKEKGKFTLKYFNGITKSAELLRMEGLTSTEKDVYAFYDTITNHLKIGKVPTWEVAYWLGMEEQKVKRAKRKLREMGLIETGLDRGQGFAHGVGVKTKTVV